MLSYEVTRRHPYLFGTGRDVDAVLDRFWGRRGQNGDWTPPLDAYVRDGNYVLRVDLPGVDPEDLDIQVEGRLLTIKGERKFEEEGHYHRETVHGKFERAVRLPAGIDADRIEARHRNGVIEVSVPLPAKAAGRKVPVQAEAGDAKTIESHAE